MPWTKFRKLCKYYSDCVKYSEHGQEYFFSNKLNEIFMLPRLPYGWAKDFDKPFTIKTSNDVLYVKTRLLAAAQDEELFIGYPLNSFKTSIGNNCVCPIMMFPVELKVHNGSTTEIEITIDKYGISLNQEWVKRHVPKSEEIAFYRAFEYSSDEFGRINIDLVLNYISNHFNIDNLSPDKLDFSIRNEDSRNGILNSAILFVSNKPQYTKKLLKELDKISKEVDSVLDTTSLAYVFREPPLENVPLVNETEKLVPVSFTKNRMNNGQFLAVDKSLNYHVSKVVGPPGTGKSFMAVNLIGNEVLNGGSVLFTSKNHKAIHAIFDKSSDAVQDSNFPLVTFCTTPDNPDNARWDNAQKFVDIKCDLVESVLSTTHIDGDILNYRTLALEKLDSQLSRYRDAEKYINRYQSLREVVSEFERKLSEVESYITNEKIVDNEETIKLLEEISEVLLKNKESYLDKVINRFWNKFSRLGLENNVVYSQLKEIAPNVLSPFFSKKTIYKDVNRILKLLKYKKLIDGLKDSEINALRVQLSEFNYENLKSCVKSSFSGIESLVQSAYLEKVLNSVSSVDRHEDLVAKCKRIVAEALQTSPLSFLPEENFAKKYDVALYAFKEFFKIFPAWATTMLSLNKASPCLPGVFSLAIIDEASQCDIAPIIPVLYRAKRIAIIGDPSQFPPVITLKKKRDDYLRKKHKLESSDYNSFSYISNSAFSAFKQKELLLSEHFRCADSIAQYFNSEFYGNALSLCSEIGRGGKSSFNNIQPGMMWVNASGGDDAEIESAINYLKELKTNNFNGTIGIISPLKEIVDKFRVKVVKNKASLPQQIDVASHINTANGFQGGECDAILFLLGLNSDRSHGQLWYITSQENKYIFNVSVSRAKHLFVAFGDKEKVIESGIPYIQKLIPEMKKNSSVSIGPGEVKLKRVLEMVGIETESQYPICGRYLDLAIPEYKIDIEVDGQAYHLDRNGCRKADDIHRDLMLELQGWRVLRFWHHEVVKDIDKCVAIVKNAIDEVKK